MRAFRLVLPLVCLVALLAVPHSSDAARRGVPPKTLSGGCTDPDFREIFCSRLIQRGSSDTENVYFELVSYRGGGYYFLCLKPPQRRELCLDRHLRLNREKGFWVVRVALDRFPHSVDGNYRARWLNPRTGARRGPRMDFTLYDQAPVPGATAMRPVVKDLRQAPPHSPSLTLDTHIHLLGPDLGAPRVLLPLSAKAFEPKRPRDISHISLGG